VIPKRLRICFKDSPGRYSSSMVVVAPKDIFEGARVGGSLRFYGWFINYFVSLVPAPAGRYTALGAANRKSAYN
jgi:hypothetical protein